MFDVNNIQMNVEYVINEYDAQQIDTIAPPSFNIIVEVRPTSEYIDYDLDLYHSPSNNVIKLAPNGYHYYDIDGLTVTFFRQLSNSVEYHIVICELNQNELDRRGILYDTLISMQPIFTFAYD